MAAARTLGAYFAASRHSEPSCIFVDLRPDAEYELHVRAKTDIGEGFPSYLAMRTNFGGGNSNIIRFPLR